MVPASPPMTMSTESTHQMIVQSMNWVPYPDTAGRLSVADGESQFGAKKRSSPVFFNTACPTLLLTPAVLLDAHQRQQALTGLPLS